MHGVFPIDVFHPLLVMIKNIRMQDVIYNVHGGVNFIAKPKATEMKKIIILVGGGIWQRT